MTLCCCKIFLFIENVFLLEKTGAGSAVKLYIKYDSLFSKKKRIFLMRIFFYIEFFIFYDVQDFQFRDQGVTQSITVLNNLLLMLHFGKY